MDGWRLMNAELKRRRDALLARAAVVAEAPGADYVPAGHGQADSKPPTGTSSSLFDLIVARINGAENDRQLERAIYEGEAAVDRYSQGPHVKADKLGHQETSEERDHRIVHQYEGMPAPEVAAWERCSTTHIWKLRRQNGRDPVDGKRKPGSSLAWANRRVREEAVADLKAKGLSLRAIADEVRISHTQVQRDLNSYAARQGRNAA